MTTKNKRKTYSAEFKEEALKLASNIGVAQTARELGVAKPQLYFWRRIKGVRVRVTWIEKYLNNWAQSGRHAVSDITKPHSHPRQHIKTCA